MEIIVLDEGRSLVTGGAFRKVLYLTKNKNIFVLKGDILCSINYSGFLNFHLEKDVFTSFVLVLISRFDSGGVKIRENGRIFEFINRDEYRDELGKLSFMNICIHILKKEIFYLLSQKKKFLQKYNVFSSLVRVKSATAI